MKFRFAFALTLLLGAMSATSFAATAPPNVKGAMFCDAFHCTINGVAVDLDHPKLIPGARPTALCIGNSDAYVDCAPWATDFPSVPVHIISWYSMTCQSTKLFMPSIFRWFLGTYGYSPTVIVNHQGQCNVEQNSSVAAFLTCDESVMLLEAQWFPGSPQIYLNVAALPSYTLGPPSNYAPMVFGATVIYNNAEVNGIPAAGIPSLKAYAASIGVTLITIDQWSMTALSNGIGDPRCYVWPNVDLTEECVSTRLDTLPGGIGDALRQLGFIT